jgi:hypothetical protein
MKLKETVARFGRNIEALAFALDYDENTDIRLRVERLERLTSQGREVLPPALIIDPDRAE